MPAVPGSRASIPSVPMGSRAAIPAIPEPPLPPPLPPEPEPPPSGLAINPIQVKSYLRSLGITENLIIHEQDYHKFLSERGIKELGRGGEGAVYFLRGHVVKLVNPESVPALMREIAHMVYLNGIALGSGNMGERARQDWPALLWIYTLSNGGLSIGMKPFDLGGRPEPGKTLHERLYGGPMVERERVFRDLLAMANSLLYSQRKGIIHHDLKPANVYIPSDPAQTPVVFDLGQALWKQTAWGRQWLRNPHNVTYWYNGTYRYMHCYRRLSHLCAMAQATGQNSTKRQTQAFSQYVPTFYDDVFSFAYMLREIVRSRFMQLKPADRAALTEFYRGLMGLKKRGQKTKETHFKGGVMDSAIFKMKSLFAKKPEPVEHNEDKPEHKWASMEQVVPELDKLIRSLAHN